MMFKTGTPVVEPAPDMAPIDDLIPLSHLRLDLSELSDVYLANHGVEVLTDDIGRKAISRNDARMLFTEQAEGEKRKAELLRRADEAAVEYDRQWRASLYRGVPWYQVPDGVTPSAAMLQAARDANPRRRSLVEDFLGRDEVAFHSLQGEEAS